MALADRRRDRQRQRHGVVGERFKQIRVQCWRVGLAVIEEHANVTDLAWSMAESQRSAAQRHDLTGRNRTLVRQTAQEHRSRD